MRTRTKSTPTKLPWGSGFISVETEYSHIIDVNNGRRGARPLSPCTHIRATYKPLPVRLVGSSQSGYLNCPARSYAFYIQRLTSGVAADHYDSCTNKIQRLIDKQIGDFSSLNFLYELRELPDLFDKVRRPQDGRYIDWQFAIQPMISDIQNALSTYDNAVASLNEKLQKYRSIPCTWTKSATRTFDGEVSYFSGNGHFQTNTARVTTRMRGEIRMDVPILSRVNPALYSVLDSLSIDVSASNAWNALPWSWFVDWFLPVGKFLKALPSSMKPLPRFHGTISHEINAFSDVESRYTGPAYSFVAGENGGRLEATIYTRNAFNSPLSSMIRWRAGGISSPSQIALLRDIMYPASQGRNVLGF